MKSEIVRANITTIIRGKTIDIDSNSIKFQSRSNGKY